MPGFDSFGQGVSLPLLADRPDAQQLGADVGSGVVPLTVMRFDSAAHRGAVITSPIEGMTTYLRDVNRHEFYDGSDWKTLSEWQTTTPTWSSTLGSVSIGNGTMQWRWTKVGKTVHARMLWIAGNTTQLGTFGVPPSASLWSWSLPVPAASVGVDIGVGSALAWRPSSRWWLGTPILLTATQTIKIASNDSGYTWGRYDDGPFPGGPDDPDQITLSLTYEAAS